MGGYRTPQEWSEWVQWLSAGLDGRCRWRLPIVLLGMLFAMGRRTVASWLRAAGVDTDYRNYYYFTVVVGRCAERIATRLLRILLGRLFRGPQVLVAIDDTTTKRYGRKVQGAGIHHNPTPGPAGGKFLFGHVWVTVACVVRHPDWGTIALPLLSKLYIRQQDIPKLPQELEWTFQTKLQQAADLLRWIAEVVISAGKQLWVVIDGFYGKRPFLLAARTTPGVVVVGRLRKDAALFDLPPAPKPGSRRPPGRPPTYGTKRISLAKRAGQPGGWQTIECVQYGQTVTKTIKTFLATYHPAYGVIRVVIVQEDDGPQFFFSINPDATPQQILEAMADRGAIEEVFHDVKEVGGAGQQQVRRLWANLGTWHLNLWLHTLVELWAWDKPKPEICDRRASPWDDPDRRPSHSDRRKALRRQIVREEFSTAAGHGPMSAEILRIFETLLNLAA